MGSVLFIICLNILDILGHTIDAQGIFPLKSEMAAVHECPKSTSQANMYVSRSGISY